MKIQQSDKVLWWFVLGFNGLALLFNLARAINYKFRGAYQSYTWAEIIWLRGVFEGGLLILVILALAYTIHRLLREGKPWLTILVAHFAFFLLFNSLVTLLGVYLTSHTLQDDTWSAMGPSEFLNYSIQVSDLNFLTYFATMAIIHGYHILQRSQFLAERESKLSQQLLVTKIKALQAQMQPHFLFNALNSISSLLDSNPKLAQEALADMSALLRETMELRDESLISLKKELEILDAYLAIMNTRMGEQFTMNRIIPKNLEQIKVPPFILQPIIENALSHGYSIDHRHITITLEITIVQGNITILVANNGKLLAEKSVINEGMGLGNLRERLETLFPNQNNLKISNQPDNSGVWVSITFPMVSE